MVHRLLIDSLAWNLSHWWTVLLPELQDLHADSGTFPSPFDILYINRVQGESLMSASVIIYTFCGRKLKTAPTECGHVSCFLIKDLRAQMLNNPNTENVRRLNYFFFLNFSTPCI